MKFFNIDNIGSINKIKSFDFKKYFFKNKNFYVIVSIILLSIISAYLSNISHFEYLKSLKLKYPTSKIICAAKDLEEGEIIETSSIAKVEMLNKNITSNTVDMSMVGTIIGRKINYALKAGDPILLTNIKTKYLNQSLSERIPEGKRLFTLSIKSNSLENGFIHPNDKVDILTSFDIEGRGKTTFTVLQNVSIVSIGKSSIVNEELNISGTDISFFVDKKDVEMLEFAKQYGEFSLSLRNPSDILEDSSSGIDINSFLDYDGISRVSGGGKLRIKEKGRYISNNK